MTTGFRNLTLYKKAFALAMDTYHVSKKFPNDELYSLTTQIRKSSRSVCSNIGEGYRKRLYEAHFISKISDSDMENTETQVWLNFALSCEYISKKSFDDFNNRSEEIARLISHIPDKSGLKGINSPVFRLPTVDCRLNNTKYIEIEHNYARNTV